ncbi:MAG TPA: TniQ family protein [Candidatus Obscuribacterales bacterium]
MPLVNFLQPSVEPWLFQVEPYPNESFGHFLGRFRRANCLSSAHLAAMLGVRSHVVAYWESPSRQRRPSPSLLPQLAQLTGVSVNRLQAMWLPSVTGLHWPTRLCPDCYAEAPWHQLTWQLADQPHCAVHQRSLVSQCPCCHHAFQLPSYWATGQCDRCQLPFAQMRFYQAAVETT